MFTHNRPGRRGERGVSLVELLLFIVIVGIALGGIVMVMNLNARHSADPLLRKQALAVAEALLEEVEMMPFTTCDPDAYNAGTGTCTLAEAMGPEAGETRADGTFDNVNDYNNFVLNPGDQALGSTGGIAVPAGYSAKVEVYADSDLGPGTALAPAADVLRIKVTVTYNAGQDTIVLEGYRTRYAPIPA